ncbi:MAG: hypothetical protein ACRCZ9_01185 [Fusobacteriaceae bacterium]
MVKGWENMKDFNLRNDIILFLSFFTILITVSVIAGKLFGKTY